jgi:hypothetical protein
MKMHKNIPISVCIVEDRRHLVNLVIYAKRRPFHFYTFAPKNNSLFSKDFRILFQQFFNKQNLKCNWSGRATLRCERSTVGPTKRSNLSDIFFGATVPNGNFRTGKSRSFDLLSLAPGLPVYPYRSCLKPQA